jgi:hypothetical protein
MEKSESQELKTKYRQSERRTAIDTYLAIIGMKIKKKKN